MPKFAETRAHQELEKLLQRYTQNELSELTGVPQSTISQVKNRDRLPGLDGALGFERVGIKPAWWRESSVSQSGEHPAVDVPEAS